MRPVPQWHTPNAETLGGLSTLKEGVLQLTGGEEVSMPYLFHRHGAATMKICSQLQPLLNCPSCATKRKRNLS